VSTTLVLPAREVVRSTPRTRIIRLGLDEGFSFAAGQAVSVGLHGNALRKPYSIASSPGQAARTRHLELLVQVNDLDPADPHLERVLPGTALDVSGPFGSFVLPLTLEERELLFIAGGTGIAPLRSMLWDAFDRRLGDHYAVVYSVRSPEEFAYEQELRQLAAAGRIDLHLTVTRGVDGGWRGLRGRIDQALLTSALRTAHTHCFVCGPPGFVIAARLLLGRAGVRDPAIQSESEE
jgi:glycine betaine catabolism B